MLNVLLQKQTLVVIFAMAASAATAAEMDPSAAAPAPPDAAVDLPEEPPTVEEQAFQDWRLACADEACAVYTRIDATDGTEVLRVELGGAPRVLRIATPLGLHLPDGLVATIGEAAGRRVPWRTCAPEGGCVADVPLDDELLAALRRERAGMAGFTLVEGVPVRLGFSLMGFSAALAALDESVAR